MTIAKDTLVPWIEEKVTADKLKDDARAYIAEQGLSAAFPTELQREAAVALMASFACRVAVSSLAEVLRDEAAA